MGTGTAIEWADDTWNPLIGCSRVSEGCDHCYAIGVVHRGMSKQHKGLTIRTAGDKPRTDWNGKINAVPHLLELPLRQTRPRRIFVNSLSDLFHPAALALKHEPTNIAFVAEIVAVMVAAKQHVFQVLTKRPKLMAAVLHDPMFRLEVNAALMGRGHEVMPGGMSDPDFAWPRHIWWGTSIESDQYSWRANHLRRVNGTRWISAEPLLGPLPSLNLEGIDWLVAGGESGHGSRPMSPEWARDLRDRCLARTIPVACPPVPLPVPFLFKQWGDWAPTGELGMVLDGSDLSTGPEMVRVGKKAAGRELDGRTWDEYPA